MTTFITSNTVNLTTAMQYAHQLTKVAKRFSVKAYKAVFKQALKHSMKLAKGNEYMQSIKAQQPSKQEMEEIVMEAVMVAREYRDASPEWMDGQEHWRDGAIRFLALTLEQQYNAVMTSTLGFHY